MYFHGEIAGMTLLMYSKNISHVQVKPFISIHMIGIMTLIIAVSEHRHK
jgi:hypothetical protein